MAAPLDVIDQTLTARYRDIRGTEHIVIHNDGQNLRTTIRGVVFRGGDFDALDAEPATAPAELESFTLSLGALCACTLAVELPVEVVIAGQQSTTILEATLELGEPQAERRGIARETLTLVLRLPDRTLRSAGSSGWFEDELLDISRQLGDGAYLLACIRCGLSDYSPYGHGLFGGLACFRDAADAYRAVSTKAGLFAVWDRLSGYVQETHVCPRFELRRPGAGYRG